MGSAAARHAAGGGSIELRLVELGRLLRPRAPHAARPCLHWRVFPGAAGGAPRGEPVWPGMQISHISLRPTETTSPTSLSVAEAPVRV